MTLKIENFTGADGQLLTALADWVQLGSGTCRAAVNASNQLKGLAGGDASAVGTNTGANDMYAQCVAGSAFGMNDGFPLAVRVTDRNSYVAARFNPTEGRWEIYTQFGRATSVVGSYTPGNLVYFDIVANVATIKVNGSTVLSDTVPAVTASNYAGVILRIAGDPVMDSWQSDSIGGAAPPVTSISNQTVAGQTLSMNGTYTGTATSGTAFLPAAAVPNGAVDVGPVAMTYGSGAWSVSFLGLDPGDYDPPEITISNGAGSDTELGTAFTVMEIDGDPQAPNPGTTVESVSAVDTQGSSVVSGAAGAVSEAGAATDTQASTASQTRATAETGAAADTTQRTVASSTVMAEAATPVEAVASATALNRTTSDTLAAAESQASSTAKAAATSEAGAAADAQDGATALGNIEVQDSVTAAELQAAQAGAIRNTPEAGAALDTQGAILGVSVARQEVANAQDTLSGLVVMGVATVESLVGLADSGDALVGTIQGDVSEVLVLTEQQFQSLVVSRGVLEVVVVDDAMTSAPVLTPTTVVDTVDVRDLVARLVYPKPPVAGSTQTRRFIVYYK